MKSLFSGKPLAARSVAEGVGPSTRTNFNLAELQSVLTPVTAPQAFAVGSPKVSEAPGSQTARPDDSARLKLKILLVDYHPLFRAALRSLLEKQPDVEVVAEVGNGSQVLPQALFSTPDVVCMDVSMPGLNGVEATRRLMASLHRIKVIAVSGFSDQHFVLEMMSAGACGYVSKEEAAGELR